MAGLLGGILPAIYSQSDRAKRYLGGLLSDPVGRMQQAGGQAVDDLNKIGLLSEQAFSDPKNPMKMQDNAAARQLVDTYLNSVLNFAPVGMNLWHGSPHKFDAFDVDKDKRGVGGVWLTNSKPYAEGLAGGKGYTYKIDADIKAPYVFDIVEEANKIADEIGVQRPSNPLEAQELLSGGMGWDSVVSDILHEAKKRGHDSVNIKNFNDAYNSNPFDVTDSYVVPNTDILKILERNGQPIR